MNYVILSFVIDFILMFLLIYILYAVFFNKKRKQYSKLKDNDIVKVFIARYDIDVRKVEYKKVLNVCTIITSFILSFTATLVLYINNFWLSIVIAFIVLFILIYSLFTIAGKYFKKMEGKKNV